MKLLIIDDNRQMREMLKQILESKFEQIVEHHDGFGALEEYEKNEPDFVLMDIKMEKVDGIQATKNITDQHPEAKIIVISQYKDDDTIRESFSAGAIKFINKENLTDLIELFNTINRR